MHDTPASPHLALLAAGGLMRMAVARLPAPDRAPFDATHKALRTWVVEADQTVITPLYEEHFSHCYRVLHAATGQQKKHADLGLSCVYLQMRTLFPLVKRHVLPGDGFRDMHFDDMVALSKRAARGHTSMRIMAMRCAHLASLANTPWTDQCAAVDRTPWHLPINERQFEKRLRDVVVNIGVTGECEWRILHGATMVHTGNAQGARSVRVSADERAQLEALVNTPVGGAPIP